MISLHARKVWRSGTGDVLHRMEANIDAIGPGIKTFSGHIICARLTSGGPGRVNPRQSARPNVPKPVRARIQTMSVNRAQSLRGCVFSCAPKSLCVCVCVCVCVWCVCVCARV